MDEIIEQSLKLQDLDQEAIRNVLAAGSDSSELSKLYGDSSKEAIEGVLRLVEENGVKLKRDGTETFVDIGSGCGHAVFYAAAANNWGKCVGVELVQEHVDQANKSLEFLREKAGDLLPTNPGNVEFICCDALDPNQEVLHNYLTQATVVYCFDLAFPSQMRVAFAKLFAEKMCPGSILIVTHLDPFPSVEFAPLAPLASVNMAWGPTPVRIYRKGPGAYDAWLELGHMVQLQNVGVPQDLWPSAFQKMTELTFDIGEYASLARVEEGSESMVMVAVTPMKKDSVVFVVDHAWSFASKQDAKAAIEGVPGLKERILSLIASTPSNEDDITALLKAAQPYLGSYAVLTSADSTEKSHIYYMLDEIGSRLRRHPNPDSAIGQLQPSEPNMKIVPIYSHDYRMAFSLAWPVVDIEEGMVLVANHEQGWENASEIEEQSQSTLLPEMKEYAAQIALQKLIAGEDEGDGQDN